MKIAVAGGTGVVGSYVVEAAHAVGHESVVLSRSKGVDLRTDGSLAEALDGVEVIIDVSNTETLSGSKASAFFADVTARLQAVGSAQGVARLVTLSIVGIDRVPSFGYYGAKLDQERAALAGPLPVTIVRATQFHEFPAQILGRMRLGPFAAIPVMRSQPVAARSVGRCLVEVAADPPTAQMIEVAGPQPEDMVSMARQLLRRRGQHVRVVPLRLPGATGKSFRGGALLPTSPDHLVGPTFDEWLDSEDGKSPVI